MFSHLRNRLKISLFLLGYPPVRNRPAHLPLQHLPRPAQRRVALLGPPAATAGRAATLAAGGHSAAAGQCAAQCAPRDAGAGQRAVRTVGRGCEHTGL